MTPKIRRQALQHYLATKLGGDRSKLMKRAGISEGRVSQILSDGFGERAARQYELSLGLPAGYFEKEEAKEGAPVREPAPIYNTPEEPHVDLNKQAADLVKNWFDLDAADRAQFAADIAIAATKVRAKARGATYIEDGAPSIEQFADKSRRQPAKGGTS